MKKVAILLILALSKVMIGQNLMDEVEHHYANNNGVKIHYVTLGNGPLLIFIHGFPDYWYTWRNQMIELSKSYKVAAIDLRGYNKSDSPDGVENYSMRILISDVITVIKDANYDSATIVGHDWGGAIAWQVAMWRPNFVEKLVILSTPHPNGLFRELSENEEQKNNSKYAQDFQNDDSHKDLNAEGLANWVDDPQVKNKYIEAFKRSDYEAMLNYYKANYPKINNDEKSNPQSGLVTSKIIFPSVECPTLVIFGKKDNALLSSGWNGTWDWVNNKFTLVAHPEAGHFIMQYDSEFVTKTILSWLNNI